MAKYKCKQLGVCDKADAGEVFDLSPGADQHCPSCKVLLTPIDAPAKKGGSKPLVAGAAVVVALLGGAGYYFTAGSSQITKTSLPVEVAVVSAPAPISAPVETAVVPTAAPILEPQPTNSSGIAPTESETKALRQESQNKLTAGDAVSAEQASSKAAANEILKLAIAKMAQGKLGEAEADLLAARDRDPKQSLVPYNMAVLRLKQGRKDDALKEFEASFMVGFSYFDQMDQDPDLDEMRKDARFNELVALYRNKISAR